MAINRVAKVVKGGRRFSFTALVVVGDEDQHRRGRLRQGERGPAGDPEGGRAGEEEPFPVPKHGTTITHQVMGRYGSGQVLLKPASEGTGVIAGGGVRAVLELAGIRDVLSKSLGTQNPINLVKATVAGLQSLKRPEDVAELRGKTVAAGARPRPSVREGKTRRRRPTARARRCARRPSAAEPVAAGEEQ